MKILLLIFMTGNFDFLKRVYHTRKSPPYLLLVRYDIYLTLLRHADIDA